MKTYKKKNFLRKIISMLCLAALCMLPGRQAYAMGGLQEEIETRIAGANAREYEMNIVLQGIAEKIWHAPPYALDEADLPVDAPLGKYTEERLREYTDENFYVEFEYCCGYYGITAREPHLIQIARIYKDGEIYSLRYYIWAGYAENDVVEDKDSCYMDIYDFIDRRDSNEHYSD
ncbi:MAG: hypothetical protein NC318_13915 [Blautia sp.]|nr:hypothetical protein [Blautia sp.]